MPYSTKDDLCNAALSFLGEPAATPFTGGTTVRDVQCALHYDAALAEVLTHHRWDFATVLYPLALADPQPDEHPPIYTKAYNLPTNYLRFHEVLLKNGTLLGNFTIIGNYLFLDSEDYDDEGHLTYTPSTVNITTIPYLAAECIAYALAVRIAPTVTQSPQLQEQMRQYLTAAYSRARTTETRQGETYTSPIALARSTETYQSRYSQRR